MKITLEKINKSLIALALASLFFRAGEFIKPFEIIFLIIFILTVIDIIKNKKFNNFLSILSTKNIILILVLVLSVFIGLFVTLFVRGISLNVVMIEELARLLVAISSFIIVLFYSKDDKKNIYKYLVALIVPSLYGLFIIFPSLASSLGLVVDGRFNGFTNNLNTTAKMFIIPGVFFLVHSFLSKSKSILYIILSSIIMSLFFWIGSRGAMVGLSAGVLMVCFFIYIKDKNIKYFFKNLAIILIVILLGFAITPYSGKRMILNRVFNKDSNQVRYSEIKDLSLFDVVEKKNYNVEKENIPETRLEIWPCYFVKALNNPFGMGPGFNTHTNCYISLYNSYRNSGSHNSYLEIWLWGGVLGFISFLFLLYFSLKNLIINYKINENIISLVLLGSLISFLVVLFFDDSVKSFWLWVIVALSLSL